MSNAVLAKQPDAKVVVPPYKTAVLSEPSDTKRDWHIRAIKERGRIAWQKVNDYGLSRRVERSIQRYRRIRKHYESTRLASAKNQGMGQCICAEHDDNSWNAGIDKNIKVFQKRERFS